MNRTSATALAALFAFAITTGSLIAQGRGGAAPPVPPPSDAYAALPADMVGLLTAAQQSALGSLVAAVNAARQALSAASLASPRNDADIRLKAAALGAAEGALAIARADQLARLQAAGPLSAEQRTAAVARINAAGGRGGILPPRSMEDNEGFVPIFDGRTLANWDGDPTFWRVEDGTIVGESTPEKVVANNSFLIWRGGVVKDFELKFDFRINATNSGMQYRSQEVAGGRWGLRGYQADLDFPNQYTGQIHDEAGRNIMAPRGQFVRAAGNGVFKFIATVADPNELPATLAINGWNRYHIIARGPVLIHVINGRVTAILIDEDSQNRDLEGLLGFQMHVGPPFKVQYRNVLYRAL
jgi:hypothetical protein